MEKITNLILNKSLNYEYILIHSDIFYLLKEYGFDIVKKYFEELFINLINKNKTIFIPTFNWDFCSTNKFNYKTSKTKVGTLSSWCLENNLFIRTNDPLYSFCVTGKDKNIYDDKYFTNAFGDDSIFDFIDKKNTLIIMINNQNFTIYHLYEQQLKCPYRYLKKFKGDVEFKNKKINNYEYEMNVKYLDIFINNEQHKKTSFLNKYINNDIIKRYEENNDFFIDFIDLEKIKKKLINDTNNDFFLDLQNKDEVKLYCSKKIINIINNFIINNTNLNINIENYINSTLANIGLNNKLIKDLYIELYIELYNNNFNISEKKLFEYKINSIINMDMNNQNIFYKLINKYLTFEIDFEKHNNSKLEEIGLDSLSILQFHTELNKNNININLNYFLTYKIIDLIKIINEEFNNIDNTNLNNGTLNNTDLDNTILDNIALENIALNNNILNNTDLDNTELDNTVLDNTVLNNTNLNNTNLIKFKKISIIGSGHCVGNKIINNNELEKNFGLSEGWIKKRTGIETRYILGEKQNFHEIIIKACNNAINNANINAKDIDLLILATSTPNSLCGDSSKISYSIGSFNASAFDITVACNGFITALITSIQFMENNNSKYSLIIGADCLSRWVDWNDKSSSILFGDGAGVIILCNNDINNNNKINYILKHKGELDNSLNINFDTTKIVNKDLTLYSNHYNNINMIGHNIYNFATNSIPELINDLLIKSNLKQEDIKYFLLHQANIRIIHEIAEKLNINTDKFLTNIKEYGNTSAASIPILLNESYEKKLLNEGDNIMMVGFGAGVNYGGIIIEWHKSNKVSNKKIGLIIGGTKGIGLAIGKKLLENNYHIILASRNNNSKIEYNENMEYYKLDINNIDNLKNLNKYITQKYKKLDLLINSAGWEGIAKKSIDTNLEDINYIININLTSVIYTINILIDLLKSSKAIIINVSSLFAANPTSICYKRNLYSMTKSALGSYTRGLSGELKDICDIYSINPSFVNTEMVDRIGNDNNIDKNILNYTHMIENDEKRLIEPDEIAHIVNLLIHKKTRYVSGDEIVILCGKKTSYMKYLYDNITNKDSKHKIIIDDIEDLSLIDNISINNNTNIDNYICIFQGQGFKNDYLIHKKESYEIIIKNNYHNKFKEITKLDFFETIENLKNDINNTYYQQLIIFMYSIIGFDLLKIENYDFYKKINIIIGYSLGEYSALVCSGKISFEDGLNLVNIRAIEMKKIASSINTGMLKVIGLDENITNKYLTKNIYISNNITDHIKIISGDKDELNKFKLTIEKLNYDYIKFYNLNVDGAFHTNYFESISIDLEKILKNINYNETKIDVISNYKAQKYYKLNFIDLLKNQVFNKVDWNLIMKSIKNIKHSYEICITKSSLNNLLDNNIIKNSINI